MSSFPFIFRPPRPLLLGAVGAAALICGPGVSSLRAELTWTQKTVELHADPEAAVCEARFPFVNGGTRPVDILETQSSCGCTTVALKQRHFEPGQTGEIVAHYTVGEQVGVQKKTILVATSDQPMATTLTLIVHIPELVRIQPPILAWRQGEPPTAKTIGIEAAQADSPLGEITVQSSNPGVTAELQPVLEGRKYQIRVTPATTDRPSFTTVTIHCRLGTGTKTFRAIVAVQAPPPTPRPPLHTSPSPAVPTPAPTDAIR